MVSLREDLSDENRPPSGAGIEHTGSLDAFAHDTREDILILAMFETRTWEHGDLQLFQLQEKLNAYVSFLLDGEMGESFPHLAEKPVRIELRTAFEPPRRAMEFLGRARDQLALQQIGLEVVLIGEEAASSGCCGGNSDGGCSGSGRCGSEGGHGHSHGDHAHHHEEHDHHRKQAHGDCCGGSHTPEEQRPEAPPTHGSCGCGSRSGHGH